MQNTAQALPNMNTPVLEDLELKNFKPRYLISKYVDWFLIGGASIIMWGVCLYLFPESRVKSSIAILMFNLSFLVNFPHFMASYFLLYDDNRKKIFSDVSFFWAAVIVPVVLIAIILIGFFAPSISLLGHLTNSLFFFVGWHYVKQIFGGVIVSNALTGYYYDEITRYVLKINLFSLWAVSFLTFQTRSRTLSHYNIPYHSYDLPDWTLKLSYYALAFTAVLLFTLHIQKYLKDKKLPCFAAIVCLLSIYVWYVPALKNITYFYMIPFFHSLQYLLFAYAFRRNKVDAQLKKKEPHPNQVRRWVEIGGHFFVAILFGGILMHYMPLSMDRMGFHNPDIVGMTPYYFAFLTFINIHHYFIDNVIWRAKNEQIKEYLLKPVH